MNVLKNFLFSPLDKHAGNGWPAHGQKHERTTAEQTVYIEELKNLNGELRQARRAALNLMEDAILSKEALRQSEEKYRTKLEKEVEARTAEVKATKEILQATLDSSFYVIQAFKAVRDRQGKIVDFTWVMNNRQAITQNGDVIGQSLLKQNPGIMATGLFEKFISVTETGVPIDQEQFYDHEQFNGWFHQTLTKLGDGFVMNTEDITERKKAEQEILHLKDEIAQKAKDKYVSLFSSMEEGFVVIELMRNEEGKCVNYTYREANPAFEKLVGLKPEVVIGKAVLDLFPNMDDWWMNMFAEVADSGQSNRFEHYLKENDNWYEVLAYPMPDKQVAILYNNITERKKVEEALRKGEDRFRTLSDAVPQVIWTNNAEGEANYFNQRWYEYSGLTYEQSVVLGWQAIVHSDDAPASVAKWQKALAGGKIFDTEYRLRQQNGAYRWFIGRNVPLKDGAGNVTGWFGSATDIEDLKQTQEALSQSEEKLRITMETATDYAIITMDTERKIERWSSGASHLFGYTEAELIGQPADIIFTGEDRKMGAPEEEMETAKNTGSAADKRWHLRKDGSRFYADGVMRPIYNPELTGYVKVARDMTQQQLFTEQLHKLVAERTVELQRSNEDLRQFAHVASHDLKEPIRKIQTFNNRILDEYADRLPPKAKTYAEKIGISADRMISMIEGVLRYSKLGNTDHSINTVDLAEIIRQIASDLEVLIQRKEARITTTELPVIMANSTLMYQLFYNLILNSLKFSKANEAPHINITADTIAEQEKDFIRLILSDNGIGFEPEFKTDIFKPFTRLHPTEDYEGTGLGLALCKKIVERHGGNISASGQPDMGAIFTILLPLDECGVLKPM